MYSLAFVKINIYTIYITNNIKSKKITWDVLSTILIANTRTNSSDPLSITGAQHLWQPDSHRVPPGRAGQAAGQVHRQVLVRCQRGGHTGPGGGWADGQTRTGGAAGGARGPRGARRPGAAGWPTARNRNISNASGRGRGPVQGQRGGGPGGSAVAAAARTSAAAAEINEIRRRRGRGHYVECHHNYVDIGAIATNTDFPGNRRRRRTDDGQNQHADELQPVASALRHRHRLPLHTRATPPAAAAPFAAAVAALEHRQSHAEGEQAEGDAGGQEGAQGGQDAGHHHRRLRRLLAALLRHGPDHAPLRRLPDQRQRGLALPLAGLLQLHPQSGKWNTKCPSG